MVLIEVGRFSISNLGVHLGLRTAKRLDGQCYRVSSERTVVKQRKHEDTRVYAKVRWEKGKRKAKER